MTLEELERILKETGFVNIDIETKVVSDEYAGKWGLKDIDLKHYLRNSTITGYKEI